MRDVDDGTVWQHGEDVWVLRPATPRPAGGCDEDQAPGARRGSEGVEAVQVAPEGEGGDGESAVTVVEVYLHGPVVVVATQQVRPAVAVQVGHGGAAVLAPPPERPVHAGGDRHVGEREGVSGGGEKEEKEEEEEERERERESEGERGEGGGGEVTVTMRMEDGRSGRRT